MGQTILGGAVTSILASIFMMLCNVALLFQFGVLFLTTIVASFLSAVVFYPSILFILGPDGRIGDVKVVFETIKRKLNERR
tara:strand:+ start:3424 stop:3666 length:243 start_codon:yes stop_codon:yes gene_type:complete